MYDYREINRIKLTQRRFKLLQLIDKIFNTLSFKLKKKII